MTALYIILAIIFLFLIVPMIVTAVMMRRFFGPTKTPELFRKSVDRFDGLIVEECSFTSNRGQRLAGYLYRHRDVDPVALVIIAHGLGSGQNLYIDVADNFAANGFLVFAYDITGHDKSGGKASDGLEQGVIDLAHAIDYARGLPEAQGLPVCLFGHSWGGYSVMNVLNVRPDIAAVISVSGFDSAAEILRVKGRDFVGRAVSLLMPYARLYQRLRFGRYADFTAMEGFRNSSAAVMIIHSEDDTVVPIVLGYDRFYRHYGTDPRFEFIRFEDRGHSEIYHVQPYRRHMRDLRRRAKQEIEPPVSSEKVTAFYRDHLDRAIDDTLDPELFERMRTFCLKYC